MQDLPSLLSQIDRDEGALLVSLYALQHPHAFSTLRGPSPSSSSSAPASRVEGTDRHHHAGSAQTAAEASAPELKPFWMVGRGLGLAGVLQGLPASIRQGSCLIPEEMLVYESLSADAVVSAGPSLVAGALSEPGQAGVSATSSSDHAHVHSADCKHGHGGPAEDASHPAVGEGRLFPSGQRQQQQQQQQQHDVDSHEDREALEGLRRVVAGMAAMAHEQIGKGLAEAKGAGLPRSARQLLLPAVSSSLYLSKLREVKFDPFHPSLRTLTPAESLKLQANLVLKHYFG